MYEDKPWLAEGVTVYQWIAARPELHDLSHWKIEPRRYRPWGDPDSPDGCGIYFLMNAAGKCFYIGQSVAIANRLLAHWRARKVPFTHVWMGYGEAIAF